MVSIKNEDNQTNNNVANETAARDLPKEIQGWTSPKKFLRVLVRNRMNIFYRFHDVNHCQFLPEHSNFLLQII